MALEAGAVLKEIKGILSRRNYYKSAKIRMVLGRAENQPQPFGGYVVLSDQPTVTSRILDYDSLVLVETGLTIHEFGDWLTSLVEKGNISLAGFQIQAKGSFQPTTWPYERFMPSDYEYFPIEWGSDFYKFKLSSQTSLPGYLPVKQDLPLYPDSQTAWGHWLTVEPGKFDIPYNFLFLFPNMDSKIDKITIGPKSIKISLAPGKTEFSNARGKLFVQETYTGSFRPGMHSDLTFPDGNVEVPLDFKPGAIYLTVNSKKNDELIDLRRSYLNYSSGRSVQFELGAEELERIIQQGETETTEFKGEISKNHTEFAETMVAFSNLRGGLILLGIDDHGEVKGVQEYELSKLDERIQNFSRELCDPPVKFTLRTIEVQNKAVVVIEIPEGSSKPYWLKNRGPITRSGSTDRVMSRTEAQQLLSGVKGPFQ